jgi:hypothetical protein
MTGVDRGDFEPGSTTRSVPRCSVTKRRPSGANAMLVGFVNPVTATDDDTTFTRGDRELVADRRARLRAADALSASVATMCVSTDAATMTISAAVATRRLEALFMSVVHLWLWENLHTTWTSLYDAVRDVTKPVPRHNTHSEPSGATSMSTGADTDEAVNSDDVAGDTAPTALRITDTQSLQ